MKIRYLTLLTTLVFLGFSVTAAAHRCNIPDPSHKHCNLEPGDDSNPWYDVFIGVLPCDEDEPSWCGGELWQASKNGQVGYQHFDPDPSWGLLNLTFLQDYFNGVEDDRGNKCFPLAVVQIHQVILNHKRSTGARALIWFHGETVNGTDVLYQLQLYGTLDVTNWPPAELNPNRMEMETWNLFLTNEGADTQAISCLAEDVFFVSPLNIDVVARIPE